jgi:non-specific serine/threonine protein kinase/serine/threonine-protein kinase
MTGRTIGHYRIIELVGEGGVGTVYRALNTSGDFEQQIAIKVLKRGMDSGSVLRRFRDERRILARLDHPNIAKFFDGGISDDGRPYFVMEFLEGTPIHHYCRESNLSVRERVELFLPVCAAVAYSHRNLVIHRDLKGTNILVTAGGVPKLLDFGIAKLLDRDTSGQVADATVPLDHMFTPDYASPEQIRGETATTAADVYSLGVLLYELLTDRRPYQLAGMTAGEMLRAIEANPPKPSSVLPDHRRSELKGDLDTIILKALHRSPERRYASAQQFADDVRRYLGGMPVHARPDTVAYRLAKYAKRHRGAFAAAALAVIAITGALLSAVWQSGVAASREAEARKRFTEMRDLASGLLGELDTSLENLPGSTASREILARNVLQYLDVLARDGVRDTKLQSDLALAYERLGDIVGGAKASNLGNSTGALASYRKAVSIFDRVAASDPDNMEVARDRARATGKVADLLAMTGDHAGALDQERKALAIREDWLRAKPGDPMAKRAVATSLQEMAGDLERLGRFGEALENRRRVLAILEEVGAASKPDTGLRLAIALANKRLGRSLVRSNSIDEALPHFARAIEIERAEVALNPVVPRNRNSLAFSLHDMGAAFARKKEHARALPFFEEALLIRAELSAADPNDWRVASMLASSRLYLGNALAASGRWNEGVAELRKSLSLRADLWTRSPKNVGAHAEVGEAHAALADALASRGRMDEAISNYERALGVFRELEAKGSLIASLAGEPKRIAGILERARGR